MFSQIEIPFAQTKHPKVYPKDVAGLFKNPDQEGDTP